MNTHFEKLLNCHNSMLVTWKVILDYQVSPRLPAPKYTKRSRPSKTETPALLVTRFDKWVLYYTYPFIKGDTMG